MSVNEQSGRIEELEQKVEELEKAVGLLKGSGRLDLSHVIMPRTEPPPLPERAMEEIET